MNNVILIGRITKDLEPKYSQSGTAVLKFNVAVDRIKKGEADFPSIIAFGKTAEFLTNYSGKGKLIAIQGHIQTGSYDKDGHKVYTTDVIADKVKPLEWGDSGQAERTATEQNEFFPVEDDDIPF